MTDEIIDPGPADKGGRTSESGAHDTNASASKDGKAEGVSLEAIAAHLAKLDERLNGFDARHKRQIDEIRGSLPKATTEQPAATKGKDGPDSELRTLQQQVEQMRNQAESERRRAALSDVFASDAVRTTLVDGAVDIVRDLVSGKVSFNSEGRPVIDNGETHTPLDEYVLQLAKEKPFLRRRPDTTGTGRQDSRSVGGRAQGGAEIDWTKATPEDFARRQREVLGGDR